MPRRISFGPLLQLVYIHGTSLFIASINTFPRPSYREVKINNFETVNTSAPSFLKIIKKIGGKFEIKK